MSVNHPLMYDNIEFILPVVAQYPFLLLCSHTKLQTRTCDIYRHSIQLTPKSRNSLLSFVLLHSVSNLVQFHEIDIFICSIRLLCDTNEFAIVSDPCEEDLGVCWTTFEIDVKAWITISDGTSVCV